MYAGSQSQNNVSQFLLMPAKCISLLFAKGITHFILKGVLHGSPFQLGKIIIALYNFTFKSPSNMIKWNDVCFYCNLQAGVSGL